MAPPNDLSIRRDGRHRRQGPATAEDLIRDAHRTLAQRGIVRSPAWVKRTVRAYGRRVSGVRQPFEAYLLERVDLNAVQRQVVAEDSRRESWRGTDPTALDAVANVTGDGF
jgi:hypothetical protein